MADDDEIDILGDFSFNSCLAQNNQGIPSCSDREDTVHPQWLLDSTATNWYDKNKVKQGPTRKLSGTSQKRRSNQKQTVWTKAERNLLASEMVKYGRNVKKISETLKSKTEAEIHALIEAEFGICLDNSPVKEKPAASLKVISCGVSNLQTTINMVQTAAPTVVLPLKPFHRKPSKNSLLKPDLFTNAEKKELIAIKPSEILYEDDLTVGSTESVRTNKDSSYIVTNTFVELKEAAKNNRKYGNYRRKVSRNFEKSKRRNSSNEKHLKSPQGRRRKNSNLSDESNKSPKLQIVLGSGKNLPISEGEQVIKIEKKKDSDSDCEVDVDVDSDSDDRSKPANPPKTSSKSEEPTTAPVKPIKFAPMPKRHKKFNLDGEGGYTIMHTAWGDLVAAGSEPRPARERNPRPQPEPLMHTKAYGKDKPPPCKVFMHVSTLILMDSHAHTSRAEVMGLAGGVVSGGRASGGVASGDPPTVTVSGYQPARAAADGTHCDMDPVSQSHAVLTLESLGLHCVGWHHSHPGFPPAPSRTDLRSQSALQAACRPRPFLAFITSQAPAAPVDAVRCITVEYDEGPSTPVGYQLGMKLVPDLNAANLDSFLEELRSLITTREKDELSVDMKTDVCPQAKKTYLEKCISSTSHHLRSAGYEDSDILVKQLLQGVRDVFR